MLQINVKPVILFDVNETLLDMTPLKKKVNILLNDEQGFRIWFGMLLHYSLVDNCTNQYHDFTTIAKATLQMAGQSLKIILNEEEINKTLSIIKELRTYPDVAVGLNLLKENGFRLATLTNTPESTLIQQLKNSNLIHYFEQTLSIDAIKKYKPAPEAYLWASKQLQVDPENIVMIAAHGWDLTGAMLAGLQTGFVARAGQSVYLLSDLPNYEALDIYQMAKVLVAQYS
ncbi:haloacid dehalogenase type II [Flavobacterium sp. LB2R40]|uniref:haloacid dehalogenase type II n=1 Tax=unclassified Flavobacterium TaxID=196869 RepID=UPI003AAC3B0B